LSATRPAAVQGLAQRGHVRASSSDRRPRGRTRNALSSRQGSDAGCRGRRSPGRRRGSLHTPRPSVQAAGPPLASRPGPCRSRPHRIGPAPTPGLRAARQRRHRCPAEPDPRSGGRSEVRLARKGLPPLRGGQVAGRRQFRHRAVAVEDIRRQHDIAQDAISCAIMLNPRPQPEGVHDEQDAGRRFGVRVARMASATPSPGW